MNWKRAEFLSNIYPKFNFKRHDRPMFRISGDPRSKSPSWDSLWDMKKKDMENPQLSRIQSYLIYNV